MRMLRLVLVLSLVAAMPALAQLEIPNVSQSASVTQTIGTTDITINYHRPGVKGRTIWGGLVPYDTPWRMGANQATTIEFSDPVLVEGKEVPAGKYSFFAIPGRDAWTFILNKDPNQWGAYGYDAAKDQVRVQAKPVAAPHTEWMRLTIDPVTPSSAVATMNWEKVAVPLRIDVDVNKVVWADIDQAMRMNWDYAANFALESGQRLDEGLMWVDRSIARGETVFNLWTKARLLQKMGRAKEAVPVMEKSVAMAKGQMPADFMAILEGTLASVKADAAK
jgi:hypothetical protein